MLRLDLTLSFLKKWRKSCLTVVKFQVQWAENMAAAATDEEASGVNGRNMWEGTAHHDCDSFARTDTNVNRKRPRSRNLARDALHYVIEIILSYLCLHASRESAFLTEAYFLLRSFFHSPRADEAKVRNALIEFSGLIDPFLWWLQATAFAQPRTFKLWA